MNIKNFTGVNAISTPATQPVGKVERQIKSESSNQDRDANGQQAYGKSKKKNKMTSEQFEKAISLLREKKFIKDMNWQVEGHHENDTFFALIKDLTGALIRRIAEYDLWELFEDPLPESTKGQLLKKTA